MLPDSPTSRRFGLIRDMLETVDVVRRFDPSPFQDAGQSIRASQRLHFTGEGSSRLFPTKQAIAWLRRELPEFCAATESGRQSQEYALANWSVVGLSNSGRTAEVIRLFSQLKSASHNQLYSVTAAANSQLEQLAGRGWVLGCGGENAVAATKSVFEQGLCCRALVEAIAGRIGLADRLPELSRQVLTALTAAVPREVVQAASRASTIYFAGRNDGVAEELTLKTNEITRKPSDFLEGTYAVHGIEEIMAPNDVVVWIDPYEESEQKFHDVLVKGVGLTVVAISSRPTRFPTILIPDAGDFSGFVQLAAGWNLLVEIGLQLDVDLDKPRRARKVGNEFTGQ